MTDLITDQEFARFQRFIFEAAGISLANSKKALVAGRLAKRLHECGARNYAEYLQLLASGTAEAEVQRAVDLLTTNETYFFREERHFAFLRELAIAARAQKAGFRVWSAASSTGEEAYSIAMVLADCLGESPWEVVGSDISTRVLARARTGHYALERATKIPDSYLKRFCLRGVGEQEGTLLIARELRRRVKFTRVNLNEKLPSLGTFDVIFLRNVLIYFSPETKRDVIGRVVAPLKPDGHLFIGHSESLSGVTDVVQAVAPAIYQKAPADRRAQAP